MSNTTETSFAKYTQPVERRITRALLAGIFAKGWTITIDNGGDGEYSASLPPIATSGREALPLLAHTGSDTVNLYEGGLRRGYIWLVWGNEEDLITDYSDYPEVEALVAEAHKSLGLY
jgi:hypothetical protein